MDFKPYTPAALNWFHDIGPAWMIAAGILLLIVVGGFFLAAKQDDSTLGSVMVIFSLGAIFFPFLIGSTSAMLVKEANSDNYVTQFKEELKKEGFQFVTGTPSLKPNSISSLMLSYEGENFDCTLYTPENIDLNIIISCGETKLTLAEVKQAKTN